MSTRTALDHPFDIAAAATSERAAAHAVGASGEQESSDPMAVWVIAAYRPHGGRVGEFEAFLREHVPALRRLGYVTDRDAILLRSPSGAYLEIFEWASRESIERAHEDEAVHRMWTRFESMCEYVHAGGIPEMRELFPEFERLA